MVYKKASIKGACCLSNNNVHQRCQWRKPVSFCKKICDGDVNCKGYVDGYRIGVSCQIATTSDCTNNGAKYNIGNVGNLDKDGLCGSTGNNYDGCFIKSSGKLSIRGPNN